jgi:hypothetical protein
MRWAGHISGMGVGEKKCRQTTGYIYSQGERPFGKQTFRFLAKLPSGWLVIPVKIERGTFLLQVY